jgi:hypothetical protein
MARTRILFQKIQGEVNRERIRQRQAYILYRLIHLRKQQAARKIIKFIRKHSNKN